MNNKNENTKMRKKSKVFKIIKFTAAAVAFGLIAGVVFQGYYTVSWLKETKIDINNNSTNLPLSQLNDTGNSDTIISTNTSSNADIMDVSDIVTNTMPSIVAINSKITNISYDYFGRQYQQVGQGSGTGIIIGQNDSSLLIVTNNHVINGATSIEIVFSDETTATAIVKGAYSNADLAVLTVDFNELSAKTVSTIKVASLGNSDEMQPGEMVIAIGNALGYGQSVTVGYVSAASREVTFDNKTMTLLQTDAAINPGNSGGALLNLKGQVIGINSVKFASDNVEGMGYAIPISDALPMINDLIKS